jgi:hypothetical protein
VVKLIAGEELGMVVEEEGSTPQRGLEEWSLEAQELIEGRQ